MKSKANVAFDLSCVLYLQWHTHSMCFMYVGGLVTAVDNNKEMAARSSDRIQPGQAGNDHCHAVYVIARQ